MVGVPGRSKGCSTCRTRKKGCDGRRPSCGQCLSSGITCGGYERSTIFISHQPQTESSAAASRRLQRSTRSPPDSIIALPAALQNSASELQQFSTFWEIYLPKGETGEIALLTSQIAPWAESVRSLYPNDKALRLALLCVSDAAINSRSASDLDNSDAQRSIRLYGQALAEVNRALQDTRRSRTDEVLAACRLLGIFEIFQSSGTTDIKARASSWRKHVNGLSMLIQARGPTAHASGHGHFLFADHRYAAVCIADVAIVISALQERKKVFFLDGRWETESWQSPKGLADELIDIFAEVPGIYERMDTSTQTQDTGEHQLIFDKFLALDQTLNRWDALLAATVQQTISCTEPSFDGTAPTLELSDIQPEDLHRYGYSFALLKVLYWTTGLALYSTFFSFLEQHPSFRTQIMHLPARTDPRFYASNIARAAPYFFRESSGALGAQNIAFPLGLAMKWSGENRVMDTAEGRNMEETLKGTKLATSIGSFLDSQREDSQRLT